MKTNHTTTNAENAGQSHAQTPFFAGKDQPAAPFFGAPLIQRKLQQAQDSSSSGLDSDTRPALEGFLNHDLGHVRVHDNPASHEASGLIQAKAYTSGNHIFMGSGTGSLAPVQRKALLAHEVVHTIQQKGIGSGTVQAKPEIGEADSPHEAEADHIAQAFIQSQATGYRSPGLQMRSNLGISPVAKPTIQRLPTTWGGEWFADTYTEFNSGTGRGVDIELRFKPNNLVDAELIGLTQAYRSIHNNAPFYLNNDAFYKGRAISAADAITTDPVTKETDEGNQIDRLKDKNNPIYGTLSLPAGDGLEKSVSLGNSVQGWHYTDKVGKIVEKDAQLSDAPKIRSVDVSKSSGQIFETTALAIKGNQTGTYYGSVRWGWRSDDKGNFAKLPLEVVSQGVPSSTFMKSAEVWNTSKDASGNEAVDLPIEQVYLVSAQVNMRTVGGAVIQLPANTRVALRHWTDSMGNFVEVMVADGPQTGQRGYIHNDYLRDERGGAFAPLGPGVPEQRPGENDTGTFVG